ncbi:MAG TPA: hypothetical protein VGV69_04290 [Solirubrobacterales bacterium]|nr:hypothetical protein [Solirubrobacterales bacterium]
MFGFVIGGSGKLYLQVYLRAVDEERWAFWKPTSPLEYRLCGRGGAGRVLLNNPTLPHPLSGRPTDATPLRATDRLRNWQLRVKLLDSERNVFVGAR